METLKLFVLFVLCIALICLKNNPDAALGDLCSPRSSVCDTTNSERCYWAICVCEENHYESGEACEPKKTYGASCTRNNECGFIDSECTGSICQCVAGKYWTASQCAYKKTHGASCNGNNECGFMDSECTGSICQCVAGKYWTGVLCADKKTYGASCTRNNECGFIDSECTGSICQCVAGKYWTGVLCADNFYLTPTNVTTQRISTTELRVSWSAPSFSSVVDGYEVDIVSAIQNNQKVVTGTTATLTSLTPGERYTITVKTRSNYRDRVETVAAAAKSEVTVPAATKGLTASETFMAPTIVISFYKSEGRADFYKVRLQRGQPDSYDDETIVINADIPTASFFNVKAGLDYNLTIISNSHGVLSAPFKEQITVQNEASEAVVGLAPANITSRSASVSWRRPHDTKGALYLYSLQIWNASTCVHQILVNCTDCNGNTVAAFHSDCANRNTTNISNTNLNDQNYLLEFNLSLFPDTAYTVYVVAYNEIGKGRVAVTPLQTLTEVPGDPTDFRYVSKTSNSIHLLWTPPMPRPGVTAYNITVYEWHEDVQQYTLFNVKQQIGYYNTSINITGLSSYWKYRFQNTAKTGKGQSGSVNLPEVTTDESAPTKVVNLKSRKIPGVVNRIGLSWSCPQQKDGRNGVIQTSTVRYSTDTPNADVIPIQDTLTLTNKDCTWNVTVEVTAEFNYTFEVFISNTIDGQPSVIYEYVEPGLPSLKYTEHSILNLVSGSETDTSVVLGVCPACFLDNKNGVIIKSGLLVCRLGNCPLRPKVIVKADYYDHLPNWENAKGVSFTSLYRTTDNDWMKGKLHSEQEKFILGGENCALADQNRFCNGPLPVDHTYWVWLFACTSAGCTEGDHLEFTLKEKGLSLPVTAGISAGVIVIIVIGIVLVVVYIKCIKPRRMQKAHTRYVTDAETFNKDDTYEDITGGQRLSVIQDGRHETDYYNTKDCPPRSDNTYDQLAVYKNEGNHDYGQINVTTT